MGRLARAEAPHQDPIRSRAHRDADPPSPSRSVAMPLRLYNTLTRTLEEFQPLDPPRVGVYACGPTVYRPPHVGNFRTFVFNDLLHRYLEWKGYEVRFVMNLTDVEDKIIDGAAQRGVRIEAVTAPMIEAFQADLHTVGVRPADLYPREIGRASCRERV